MIFDKQIIFWCWFLFCNNVIRNTLKNKELIKTVNFLNFKNKKIDNKNLINESIIETEIISEKNIHEKSFIDIDFDKYVNFDFKM